MLANLPVVRVFSLSVAEKRFRLRPLVIGAFQVLESRGTIWWLEDNKETNYYCSDDVNDFLTTMIMIMITLIMMKIMWIILLVKPVVVNHALHSSPPWVVFILQQEAPACSLLCVFVTFCHSASFVSFVIMFCFVILYPFAILYIFKVTVVIREACFWYHSFWSNRKWTKVVKLPGCRYMTLYGNKKSFCQSLKFIVNFTLEDCSAMR